MVKTKSKDDRLSTNHTTCKVIVDSLHAMCNLFVTRYACTNDIMVKSMWLLISMQGNNEKQKINNPYPFILLALYQRVW